jgi:hypothetical protein
MSAPFPSGRIPLQKKLNVSDGLCGALRFSFAKKPSLVEVAKVNLVCPFSSEPVLPPTMYSMALIAQKY